MFRKWFNQASQIDTLTRDLDFERRKNGELENLLEREETRNGLLEKAITQARNSEIRTLRQAADVGLRQLKLTPVFVKDAEPKEAETLFEYDDEMERRITEAAKLQRDIDPEPQSLEFYEEAVRKDPDRYFPH
jgi:hypothetical protein